MVRSRIIVTDNQLYTLLLAYRVMSMPVIVILKCRYSVTITVFRYQITSTSLGVCMTDTLS